jgi:hypothetical protein
MAHEQYVEHILSSLSQRSTQDLQSHLHRLDSILEQIEKVESPEKEALLVRLILQPHERSGDSEPLQSSL